MSNSEKILKTLSNLIENGILSSKDIQKEISNDLKFKIKHGSAPPAPLRRPGRVRGRAEHGAMGRRRALRGLPLRARQGGETLRAPGRRRRPRALQRQRRRPMD